MTTLAETDCTRLATRKDMGFCGAREAVTWWVGRASRRTRWQLVFARRYQGLTLSRDRQESKGLLPLHHCLVRMMNNPTEVMGPEAEGRQRFKILLAGCDRSGGAQAELGLGSFPCASQPFSHWNQQGLPPRTGEF